jgi:hypothetical protein
MMRNDEIHKKEANTTAQEKEYYKKRDGGVKTRHTHSAR